MSLRERNMLNIYAALHQGLRMVPSFVLDKSQSIGRTSNRIDGTIPTLTTSSDIWCFADGDKLSPVELMKLMGHDVTRMNLAGMKPSTVRHHLGMSVHVGIAGFVMAALIASIGSS